MSWQRAVRGTSSGGYGVCLLSLHRLGETHGGTRSFVKLLANWLDASGVYVAILSRSLSNRPIRISKSLDQLKTRQAGRVELPLPLYAVGLLFHSVLAVLAVLRLRRKHPIDVVHSQDLTFSGVAGVVISKLCGVPLIAHSHGPFADRNLWHSFFWRAVTVLLAKTVSENAFRIIATDSTTKSLVVSVGAERHKVEVIPAAIDVTEAGLPVDSSTEGDVIHVTFIGRLSPEKNLFNLLRAFAWASEGNQKNLRLLIVGDGPLLPQLRNETRRLGVDQTVVFTGPVDHRTVHDLLKVTDIFVLPSLMEGCPISLLEAMSWGKAIVASAIPSIRELIEHENEGVLVNPYDTRQIAHAIERLSNSPRQRSILGSNALARSRDYHTNLVFPRIQRIYNLSMES